MLTSTLRYWRPLTSCPAYIFIFMNSLSPRFWVCGDPSFDRLHYRVSLGLKFYSFFVLTLSSSINGFLNLALPFLFPLSTYKQTKFLHQNISFDFGSCDSSPLSVPIIVQGAPTNNRLTTEFRVPRSNGIVKKKTWKSMPRYVLVCPGMY